MPRMPDMERLREYRPRRPRWLHGPDLDRLREAGYEVVVLDEGSEKEISGAEVREALRSGGDWEPLVPPGVAALLRRLERVAV